MGVDLFALAACLVVLFPFYWMVLTSFRGEAAAFAYPPKVLPTDLVPAAFLQRLRQDDGPNMACATRSSSPGLDRAVGLGGSAGGLCLSRYPPSWRECSRLCRTGDTDDAPFAAARAAVHAFSHRRSD